ncbi:hypothetical protein QEH58_18755 [Roseibacillus persicicus]|nr:hypothetical protein [Roseibacillus persicicus]
MSPLSSDIINASSLVLSKESTLLPPQYNQHIRQVAQHIQSTQSAQRSYQAQMGQVTGDYAAARKVAPRFGVETYKLLRGNQRELSLGDAFGGLFSIWAAQGIVESNYRSRLENAFVTTMAPVIEDGKRLVLTEHSLTRDMQVATSEKLNQKVQGISDEHYRRLLAGSWKEKAVGIWTPRVWLFSTSGTYNTENPITSTKESGSWSINAQTLTLRNKFGNTRYRLEQDGKKIVLNDLGSGEKRTLHYVGQGNREYQNLLRSLKGNVRFNYRF